MLHEEFRTALENGDVKLVKKLAAHVMPHLPQPQTYEDAEMAMHLTRTARENISFKARAYSHKWLVERNLPSHLPDHLKPSAERVYPRIVEAVGIACKTRNPLLAPAYAEAQRAMEDVVSEMYADGDTDPVKVKQRMMEAREKKMQQLFGSLGAPRIGNG